MPNPFPVSAVASLHLPEEGFWSIETEALKEARAQLAVYLARAAGELQGGAPETEGMTLAIVGDYGTGKTHIAQDMLRQIATTRDPHLHPLYLDAPSDTFLALYRDRFMKRLDQSEVLERVEEYYADVVADDLGNSELTRPVADALRQRKVRAAQVVEDLGLMESKFIQELGKRLEVVTRRPDFGTALLLLRRPEFRAAAWEWLSCREPDPMLEERGIKTPIDSDAAALEAIGVMAFLFGQQRHRFILFIDEIEKVLSHRAPHQPREAAVLALKKLMEAMLHTRALLVLIGLPEFLEFLPDDARQRIAAIIRPSALTAPEVEQYIREAQRRTSGTDQLEPFSSDTVDYLAEVAGGNARKMVRLCYHTYIEAETSGGVVTRALIREVARKQFELTKAEDVSAEIIRCIESRGWLCERNKTLGKGKTAEQVDFWLPYGEGNVGIAILLTQSVLQESEAQALQKRASAVTLRDKAAVKRVSVLVVNGYLADNLRPALEAAFGKVLVYRLRNFQEDLDAVLLGLRANLEQLGREDILASIKQRVDEIARQGSNVESRLREAIDRGVSRAELQSSVAAGLRAVFGQLATGTASSPSEADYPHVVAVFDRVQQLMDSSGWPERFFDFAFGLPLEIRRRLEYSDPNFADMYRFLRRREGAAKLMSNFSSKYDNSFYAIKLSFLSFRRGIFSALGFTFIDRVLPFSQIEIINDLCRNYDEYLHKLEIERIVKSEVDQAIQLARDYYPSGFFEEIVLRNVSPSGLEVELRRLPRSVYDACRDERRISR
jgi:Cdc6-like AAA superfamily ATPase